MFQRMIKAAMFDTATYEEIEADRGALDQAVVVVILVTFCGIIGSMLTALLAGLGIWAVVFGLLAGLTFGVARWAVWVTALYLVGGMILRTTNTQTSWTELARVVGFAYTPGILSIFSFLPFVGSFFFWAGFFWTIATVVVATRQSLDFESTPRAIGVVVLAGLIALIPWWIIIAIQSAVQAIMFYSYF